MQATCLVSAADRSQHEYSLPELCLPADPAYPIPVRGKLATFSRRPEIQHVGDIRTLQLELQYHS